MTPPTFAAVPDATIRGPILSPLLCGCVVDDCGAVWEPCPGIAAEHANAVGLARAGIQEPRRFERVDYRGMVPVLTPLEIALNNIAAHVVGQEQAAHRAAEQEALGL